MTQKELLYVEDAVMHEDSIVKIIREALNNASDEEIVSFLESEKDVHENLKQKLLTILEEKVNE